MTTWAILLAAGRGTRFGARKQFLEVAGTRVVDRSVHGAHDVVDAVVLVLPEGERWDGPPVHAVVTGGAERSDSVRAGLAAIPEEAEVIVVHDAARPLASRDLWRAVIAAVREGADAAIPGVPVADTVKRVDAGRVLETVARHDLVAVQTPQAFRAEVLRRAHEAGGDATDDAGLVERVGGTVVVVPGEVRNRKVTDRDDLVVLEAWLSTGVDG
ncbi:MAG: 2-C-methyl-D-erythritol 4-phosphate cytidylyltransferase [Actinomycetes bacterium]